MEEISPLPVSDSASFNTGGLSDYKLQHKPLSQVKSGELRELSFKNLSPGRPSPSASGLVAQRSDGSGSSVIKAVNSAAAPSPMADDRGEEVVQPPRPAAAAPLPPLGATPERLLVIPAGGLGKSASRLTTPRSKSGLARTPSGAVSIDITTRSPSRTVARTPTREIDRLHVESRAPPRFTCPIGGRVMRDPVILATGTTCDRGALERYLAKGNKRCPVTKRPLRKPIHLLPNIELRQNIAAWARRNAPWILDADGQLASNEPDPAELGGDDPQYVTPVADGEAPGASGAGRSPSRIESSKGSWRFTDGSKVRPGAQAYDISASAGGGTAGVPWASHRGIASAPRSSRRHRSVSRSVSPSKRDAAAKRDWWSTGFLAAVSLAHLILFIMSLWQGGWELQPLAANPWYGPGQDALAAVGAQALPLMEANGSYWRLLSAPFLPAGVIHLLACLAGLWACGRYAQLALPRPQISVPAVYIFTAVAGALVEANLDAVYLTCGAWAGVAGLLGAVAADQAVNFGSKKLWNMQEWYVVTLILLLPTAAIVTTALFPMVGLWSAATALACGFLGTAALLLAPRVGRGKPGNPKWATLQILASLLVVGVFFAAVAGVALPSKLGESVGMLQDASCIDFGGSLQCVPFGFTPSGCGVQAGGDGAATLVCPAPAAPVPLPEGTAVTLGNAAATDALCAQYCSGGDGSGAAAEADAPPAPPADGAVPIAIIGAGTDGSTGTDAAGAPPAPADPAPGTIVVTDPSAVTTIPSTLPAPAPTPPAPAITITSGSGVPTTVIPATTMSAAAGRKLRAGARR